MQETEDQLKNKCIYCGNNPVPHLVNWYFESLNVLLTPLRVKFLHNQLTVFLKKEDLGQKLAFKFLRLGRLLRIVSLNRDLEKCKVRRAQVLWEEAGLRGIEMSELLLLKKPFDVYLVKTRQQATHSTSSGQAGSGQEFIFSGLPRPRGYDSSILEEMDDKAYLKNLFRQNGLPVPEGGAVWNFKQARKIFQKIQSAEFRMQNVIKDIQHSSFSIHHSAIPVIVKPRAGSRGRHSTIFVSSVDDLKTAYKIAKQLCFWVVVEEQLFGPVYRATLIDYKLEGVLRGDPPQITGDGILTVEQLINKKNQLPHLGVKDIVISEETERFVQRELGGKIQNSNFKENQENILNYIPANGEVINLSEKIGVNYGGSSSEDFEICHGDNRELFVRAAKVLGDPVVGFDFIIPDIKKSWKEQTCGFIEANSLPFINLHHDPLLGQSRNVAAKVWQMMGKELI